MVKEGEKVTTVRAENHRNLDEVELYGILGGVTSVALHLKMWLVRLVCLAGSGTSEAFCGGA